MLTRRAFCLSTLAAASAGLTGCQTWSPTAEPLGYRPVPQLGTPGNEQFRVPHVDLDTIDERYHRQRVAYRGPHDPGTIVVDTSNRFLFLVEDGGSAIRYGIGIGRAGMDWSGRATIKRKEKWPTWTPPQNMIDREPRLQEYADGMDPGPTNPLGARALYLYQGGVDTLYRIHGTNEPWSIGRAVSSGCIRMLNIDAIDLYERVPIGTKVVVMHNQPAMA